MCFSTGISKVNFKMNCLTCVRKEENVKYGSNIQMRFTLNKQGLSCVILRPSSSMNTGLKRSILRGSVVELDK